VACENGEYLAVRRPRWVVSGNRSFLARMVERFQGQGRTAGFVIFSTRLHSVPRVSKVVQASIER
jgi:hypothetical protein